MSLVVQTPRLLLLCDERQSSPAFPFSDRGTLQGFVTGKGGLAVKATLLVIQGIDQGVRFEISDKPAGLGRDVSNAVCLHDTEASRFHARIDLIEGAFVVSDLNSSNGTFVNGGVVRSLKIDSGDQIQIGRSVLLFSRIGAPTKGVAAAAKIEFVAKQEAEDLSSIVSSIGQDVGRGLAPQTQGTGTESVAQSLANLQVLYRISEEAVRHTASIEQVLERILDLTIEVVGADRGCVLLRDVASSELRPQAIRYRRGVDQSATMPISSTIVNSVLNNRQGIWTSDAQTDARFTAGQSIFQAGIREAICVPMQGRYELMGVIYVDITTLPERVLLEGRDASKFNEDLLRLMIAIGRQSALAVEDNRYQQALVSAERLAAVGQTIATLSHHIKNILQGVRGGSYLIEMGLKDHNEDVVRKGWGIVDKNQTKIYNLVMDMLTFSTERQPAMIASALNETVADICELMQARAVALSIEFAIKLCDDMPTSLFDPDGINRAVMNIVTNAIDAVEGKPGGSVVVRTQFLPENKTLNVVVTDNGPGIPQDQLAQIFQIFESTKGARGTGLGLAVSRKIIREHGGDIHVESSPDHGSQFTLQWQLIREGQTEQTES